MKKIFISLATLGVGYFPVAPGTAGSVFAFFIYLLIPEAYFSQSLSFEFINLIKFIIIFLLGIIGIFICTEAEKYLGHDDKKIIYDEVIGYFFATMFLPKSILIGFIALILFRIFDILKPPPIYQIQSLPKGLGIMIDDVLAGIFSNIILIVLYVFFLV